MQCDVLLIWEIFKKETEGDSFADQRRDWEYGSSKMVARFFVWVPWVGGGNFFFSIGQKRSVACM